MKKVLITTLLSLGCIFWVTSCRDKNAQDGGSQDNSTPESTKGDMIALSADGSIDGNKLSLGRLSDIFDDGLTIEKAKKIFGEHPLLLENGKSVELRYAVSTNKIYVSGMRITSISIYFENEPMTHASVNCTKYER